MRFGRCQELEKEGAQGPKPCDPAVAETTWMFRLFGGHIVNEVKCDRCEYASRRADPYMVR